VAGLLSDLQARGLSVANGILVVIDGSKASAAGVRKVWARAAQIQRCTLHKRRDVAGYLSASSRRGSIAVSRAPSLIPIGRGIASRSGDRRRDQSRSSRQPRPRFLKVCRRCFTVRRLGLSGTLAVSSVVHHSSESDVQRRRRVMGNVKRCETAR